VFVENVSDARLMERIAKETGARIGDRVYSDALSDGTGPAGTYIDMLRHNIRAFSSALSS
jgi:zinc/manganese transport system substrate-binding protein